MAEILRCKRCGGESPADARFCIECGAGLAPPTTGPTTRLPGVRCPSCGTSNPEQARFCVVCGRGLVATAAPPQRPAAAPRPAPMPSRPAYSARQHSYPRIAPAPLPIRVAPARPRPQHHGGMLGAIVLVVGLLVLLSGPGIWPGILALFGISGLIRASERGRPDKGLAHLIWWCGLALLFATGTLWPGVLVLLLVSMMLGGRRHHRPWW